MELSDTTIQVLKNFSTINPNLMFHPGKEVKTISEANNILAKANVPDEFPRDFGVYDLSEFLGVLNLVDNPTLSFADSYTTISDGSGRSKVKYFYSDEGNLTTPSKDLAMPDPDVKFVLDFGTLNKLRKASSTLGHNGLSITNGDGSLVFTIVDSDNPTSNNYQILVDGEFDENMEFNFILKMSDLKILDGDYKVGISSRNIAQFDNTTYDRLSYWIALNRLSTYGVKKDG